MLVFCDCHSALAIKFSNGDNIMLFNLSSMYQGVEQLNLLPPLTIISFDQDNFDQLYYSSLINQDDLFLRLFKISYYLFNGYDVIIMISHTDVMDMITESFAKIFQHRYGYNYQVLNELSDLDYYDESSFSLDGISNYEMDLNRAINLSAPYIQVNGNE